MSTGGLFADRGPVGILPRLAALDGWGIVLLILIGLLGAFGTTMLYSAAEMSWEPWAGRHLVRLFVFGGVAVAVALIPIAFWRGMAYPFYAFSLLLLVGVEFFGETRGGSTRWLSIGGFGMQPSELMKIALVLALARFFHDVDGERINHPLFLLVPVIMIGLPAALILKQPDLGTAIMCVAIGGLLIFLAGLNWRWILWSGIGGIIGVFVLYRFYLEDYQRRRIDTLFNPENDPMGAGYHIRQSTIAMGSGGGSGKGLGAGTQTQLDFLPEKHTDFIFTVIGEELGFLGTIGMLALVMMILGVCGRIALSAQSAFARVVALGITVTFALYVFINTGMVMGLLPVVGMPLPLVSYGGTVMLAVMIGFGLVLNAHIDRNTSVSRF
jgi:rod shape determining protein RodA